MRDFPSGTVTFLFTDVEGSTRLLHQLGAEGYGQALAEHRRVLRRAFAAHGGVEVDTQGDSFFVAFSSASGAAAAANDAHRALGGQAVRVRIGLHTGVPVVTDSGYVGAEVHRGARIAALAHGGQTLVSAATAALLEGAVVLDLGAHRLKDFDGATRLYQLGHSEFAAVRTPGSVELPTPATVFIGREDELFEAVSVVLERDPRLLTLVGAGGTGKTRFSIELARLLAEEADGGTVFVPLAPLRDAGLAVGSIAAALGAASPDVRSIAAVVGSRRTHVVLDNVEHLLPSAAEAIASLVSEVPPLRLIATSREPLRIQGEHEFDLPPLIVGEAVALFLARAQAVRPGLDRTPAVDELCRRLDHLPLALELAAARTKLLAPESLLDRLGTRLDLLRGTRDADPRHATLRATIAWSHDLLTADERRLFARLSVFAAGCTLESAEAVCDAEIAELESLLDKSLVRRRTGLLGEDRFWMLETIREYATERLEESGEANLIRSRHAQRMHEIASSAHLSVESGMGIDPQRHELVLAERDDVRASLDWTAEHDVEFGLTCVIALEGFWAAHSPQEGEHRLILLLSDVESLAPELEAAVLRLQGNHASLLGDPELAERRYKQSLSTYRALGDERGAAILLPRLASNVLRNGDVALGRSMADEALALARRMGMLWVEAQAVATLGYAHRAEGDVEAAWSNAQESAEIARQCGFRWWEAGQRAELLELGIELGRLDEAEEAGREALRLSSAIENRVVMLVALTGFALIELQRRNFDRAGRLWGAVSTEHERDPLPKVADFAAPLAEVTDPRFVQAREEGRTLELPAAVSVALG